MASLLDNIGNFGNNLKNFIPKVSHGVNPLQALTSPIAVNNSHANPIQNLTPQQYADLPMNQPAPDQQGSVYGTSTGGGGGSAPAYDPNVDPNLVGQARGMITGDQNTLNNLYASLTGQLTGYANDANNRINTQFGQQQTANDKAYQSGTAGINSAYGARGAYDSSYRGNDIGTATDSYKQSNQGLMDGKNAALAGIGSTIQGVQGQINDKPQYDLSQYNDVNALTTLHNQLGQHIASLKGTAQQLTPQGELVQKLNSIVAPTSNLDATLKGQLDGLIKANTPAEALTPLATAYLTRAGITDPTKQKQYFDYLASLQQQTAPNPAANNLALQGA